MNKLFVIGDNCFDITVKGSLTFFNDKNFIPSTFHSTPAGTGVNFSIAFSRLGGKAEYITPVSVDSFGREIRKALADADVEFDDLFSSKNTALIIAFVDDAGERTTFALIRNSAYTDLKFRTIKNIFERDGINSKPLGIYVSGGILTEEAVQNETVKIVDFAKKNGVKVFFDPQIRIGENIPHFIEITQDVANLSDIIFANSKELSYLSLNKDSLIVEKRGAMGALLRKNGRVLFEVKGIDVKAVDTSGAGDVFNAAFLSLFTKGKTIQEALVFANIAAAFSVTKIGVYFPTIDEIKTFSSKIESVH
jgi:sugar/nucleoside kinase (ribokinase family)